LRGWLLDHLRSHLTERHSVDELAALACMSPRHFAREFRARTGVTPAKAVERMRVEAARAALEEGAASVQRVALDAASAKSSACGAASCACSACRPRRCGAWQRPKPEGPARHGRRRSRRLRR
jgi:AraC-like DNA-binding protein